VRGRTVTSVGLWQGNCPQQQQLDGQLQLQLKRGLANGAEVQLIDRAEFQRHVTDGRTAICCGAALFFRAKTLDVLRQDKQLKVNPTSYRLVFSLLSEIGFSPCFRLIPRTIYRSLFKQVLCSSKISMTDGGAYDIVIRKFVEITASGALLLARPSGGFDSLGFVNVESAVLLNEADPVGQLIELLADIEILQAIAHRGRRLFGGNTRCKRVPNKWNRRYR
jgi:hypothetical protein